jgi:uncharacterized damage-inducible protein DinB
MSLTTALLAEFKHEAINTRKMLERVPTDKLEWRPHEKSMTIGRLATHLAEIPLWTNRIMDGDEFDFAKTNFSHASKESTDAIVQLFDERMAAAVQVLEAASDEDLGAIWSLKQGDHVYFTLPRKVTLRSLVFNHSYHHRGQLSVYLRLLDVSVPGMYGPSADER